MNILRYAFKNIFRNFFLSVSSVLTIALLVFFVNILLLVVHVSDEFISAVNDKISMAISFQSGYNNTHIRSQDFLNSVATEFPWISVKYISKEESLRIFSERHADLAFIVEDASEHHFPDMVQFSQIPPAQYEQFNDYISGFSDIIVYSQQDMTQKLINFQDQYENVKKVVNLLQWLTHGVFVLIGLFLVTAFIMTHMTIRNFVFFLQDEVRIIELVGGKPSFIYGPLMIQGIIYTVLGVCFAFCAFAIFQNFGGISLLPSDLLGIFTSFYEILSAKFLIWQLAIAVAVGVVSAWLAAFKYIHSTIRE